jgi:hypothetical protein
MRQIYSLQFCLSRQCYFQDLVRIFDEDSQLLDAELNGGSVVGHAGAGVDFINQFRPCNCQADNECLKNQ